MVPRFIAVTKSWKNGDVEGGLFINVDHIVKLQRVVHEGKDCTRIHLSNSACVTLEVIESPEAILAQL